MYSRKLGLCLMTPRSRSCSKAASAHLDTVILSARDDEHHGPAQAQSEPERRTRHPMLSRDDERAHLFILFAGAESTVSQQVSDALRDAVHALRRHVCDVDL